MSRMDRDSSRDGNWATQRLRAMQGGATRIVSESPSDGRAGSVYIPRMECCVCEVVLVWDPANNWWVCPGCGFRVTATEEEAIIHKVFYGLELMLKDAKKKQGTTSWWRSLLARLLNNRRTLPP